VNINGYTLRKGQWIVPQISIILRDPKIYPNPKAFQPERFLDEDGKLKRADELIPFSIGKRQCLGEGLARLELFLVMANLLNQYKVKTEN
jgi:cytochrome P450